MNEENLTLYLSMFIYLLQRENNLLRDCEIKVLLL